MPFVTSTLTASQVYTIYSERTDGNAPTVVKAIRIDGGSGLPGKHMLVRPAVITEVTAEDLGYLRKNPVFKLHSENGYITVSEHNPKAEKAAADMTAGDKSAPKTAKTAKVAPDMNVGKAVV